MKKIILTGGGTAGHVAPNLALLPHLSGYEVHYFGADDSIEQRMCKDAGVAFHPLPCIKFRRSLSLKNLGVPIVLSRGVREAKKLFRELNPSVVFGKGGFAALPATLAATKCGVPLIIHESDLSMGLSNKIVAKKSKYVCTSFPELAEKDSNGIFTGAPIREELFHGNATEIAKKLSMPMGSKLKLLIFGGSLGATAINAAVESSLSSLVNRYDIVHIAGKHPSDIHAEGYRRLEFCDFMADCYAWADMVVCRGGSGALSEITALRKPSLVIPLPKSRSSRGDQEQNAAYFLSKGMVKVLPQHELSSETLLSSLTDLERDRAALIGAMAKLTPPHGARKIAELIKSLT